MPAYEVKCPIHGEGITHGSMQEAMDKKLTCFEEGCLAPVERWYARGAYAADHSENTFRPWYSENLTKGDTPVLVENRQHQQRLMDQMGLRFYEPGETRDAVDRRRKHKEDLKKAMSKGLQETLHYYANVRR